MTPFFVQDDDIKGYVKKILDEANLEEITMKTVCKEVYAQFPGHDLTHKKEFIKATVKSVGDPVHDRPTFTTLSCPSSHCS